MMGSSHLAAYLTKGQKTGIKTDKRDKRKKVKKEGSNEKVTSGIVAINAWKAHFKKFR